MWLLFTGYVLTHHCGAQPNLEKRVLKHCFMAADGGKFPTLITYQHEVTSVLLSEVSRKICSAAAYGGPQMSCTHFPKAAKPA